MNEAVGTVVIVSLFSLPRIRIRGATNAPEIDMDDAIESMSWYPEISSIWP